MHLTAICCQLTRGLNVRTRYIYNVLPFSSQHSHFSTTKVHMIHHRICAVPDSTQKKLRKQYGLSDDYFVIYKEPKLELNHMIILKCSELGLYTLPLWLIMYTYCENELQSFISQDDFYIGVLIVCGYLVGIRFFVNGFVKIIFYNSAQDVYRAYVLNKYKPTYKFVDFKSQDLKVLNLHPDIPMARNLFKAGKQLLVLHDDLFSSHFEQDKLIGEAIEKWHAHWGR